MSDDLPEDELPEDFPEFGDAPAAASPLAYRIPDTAAGDRLDKALAAGLPDLSRSRLRALLDQGCVRCDGRTITDASVRVKPGQIYEVRVPAAEPAEPRAQDIPLDVVFEDADVLVIDKPAGLVVHPAAGNPDGTLVNALLAHCGDSLSGIGGVRRPGIVHRLDKDTSGLMVVAKNDRAHHGLTEQFADRTLSRTYLALVWGVPNPAQGRIEGNIGRSSADRKKMAVVTGGGKPAATRYRVLQRFGQAAALVECVLETGRTHQIRVHLTHAGHPLVGDPLYGRGRSGRPGGKFASLLPEPARGPLVGFPRQALHAAALTFRHPGTGEIVTFHSPIPADIHELIVTLEMG
ncbi:RluA family pseudouridine synthase [Azospirillum picis]|uniref:Pseudouridine synthase n=1 Tax=Azospirillum picis TaxID=488438 RepID=A0ABU0MQU1_9PROT|nr:RluA family pseudouridine synthase [Azospirillum picis]MBP2302212.1 23S rRNA pseudouridine1911/1915/1917 synthase [Azospirillum picis]MDQ0535791.1 23S rRNA pseudouridine1911/1915/1917 synthase [Azospirillum picis]